MMEFVFDGLEDEVEKGAFSPFYLSTTRISMQYHPWYIIFDTQRIFLEQKLISHGYF